MSHSNYVLSGVMGWPVGHSRSPLLHKHWFKQCGIQGDYALLAVAPEQLATALRGLGALGFRGCNLTIPHKVAALDMVDTLDAQAKRVGAVNTIVVEHTGALTGYNTDAAGYIQSIQGLYPQWHASDEPICIIGAGGAARAVVVGLLDAGATHIRLCNRSDARTDELLAQINHPALHPVAWSERHAALDGAAMLVNTTNQGMHGQAPLDLRLDLLPVQALVSDIVYIPLETTLLTQARTRGNPTINGLGMLVCQARLAFEAWTGVLPEVEQDLLSQLKASF